MKRDRRLDRAGRRPHGPPAPEQGRCCRCRRISTTIRPRSCTGASSRRSRDNPIGTGPFTLAEFAVGDKLHPEAGTRPRRQGVQVLGRRRLSRRDPLPELRRREPADRARLGRGGRASTSSASSSCRWRSRSTARSSPIRTAQTVCCRFRVDEEPFNDKKLRQAIAKALDNAASRRSSSRRAATSARTTTSRRSIRNISRCRPCSATSRPPRRSSRKPARRTSRSRSTSATPTGRGTRRRRSDARPAAGGRHHAQRQRDAGVEILGDLDRRRRSGHRLDASSARHDGAVARLPHRRRLERERLRQSGVRRRRSTRRRRRSTSRRARPRWRRSRRSCRTTRSWCSPIWRPVYTFTSNKVHNYPPHPTLYHQFNKVWIGCLI